MKRGQTFLANAVVMAASSVVFSALSMAFNVYLSNKIGPEGMGVFQLVMSVYMFAITLSMSGVGLATTRLVAEELARGSEKGARTALFRCLTYSLLFSLFAGLLLFFSAGRIAESWLHNTDTAPSLRVIALTLPFLSLSSVFGGYFIAVRRAFKSASGQIIEQLLRIGGAIYLLNFAAPPGLGNACLAVVWGGALAEGVSLLYLYVMYIFDRRRNKGGGDPSKSLTKRMLCIALPVALSSYLRSGLATLKQLLVPIRLELSGISCAAALGQYGVIRGMALPVLFFPSSVIGAIGALLVPEVARFHVRGEKERINDVISRMFRLTLFFSVGTAGILAAFAGRLGQSLYGNSDAGLFIGLLAPLVVVMYLDGIVDGILKGLDKQMQVMRINLIDMGLSIAMIYFLLPVIGIQGYVISIIVSELINGIMSLRVLFRATRFTFQYANWLLKPSLALAAALFITKSLPGDFLAIDIAAAALIYAAGLFFLIRTPFSLFRRQTSERAGRNRR